jgi:NAD(P)-dependent dehydrogenase (short-subunit alcohol dehydrogenase family)
VTIPAAPRTAVLVTGGASGIGRASADCLLEAGRPVAIWDIDAEAAERVASALSRRHGVAAIGFGIDLREPDCYAAVLAETRQRLGRLGGLVHAAGVVDRFGFDVITLEQFDAVQAVNLRPLLLLSQLLLPDLKALPGSAIVAIASINATLGSGQIPAYSASKGAMLSLVRSLADRLVEDGIRVNSVSPGQIATPMLQPVVDARPGLFEQRILMRRLGQPEEVGRVVRFLLSDEASYVTAAEFVVDGGNISSQR